MIALIPITAVGNPELWEAARERLSRDAAITHDGPLSALLDLIDEGWSHLRELQEEAEDARATVERDSSLAGLLDFIQSDVLDVFRSLAEDCTGFVLAAYEDDGAPEADDIHADAEDFASWVAVLGFAASSPAVPQPLSRAMRDAGMGSAVRGCVGAGDEFPLRWA